MSAAKTWTFEVIVLIITTQRYGRLSPETTNFRKLHMDD